MLTGQSRATKDVKSRDAPRPETQEQCMVMSEDRCPARCIYDEEALLGVRQSVSLHAAYIVILELLVPP